METTEISKEKIRERRNFLKGLSKPIQILVKQGRYDSVNEGLKDIYADDGHTELKTIRQWNKDGKRVKKGEKALLLWGTPKNIDRKAEAEKTDSEETDEMDYFPICFVFSQKQIEEGGAK